MTISKMTQISVLNKDRALYLVSKLKIHLSEFDKINVLMNLANMGYSDERIIRDFKINKYYLYE